MISTTASSRRRAGGASFDPVRARVRRGQGFDRRADHRQRLRVQVTTGDPRPVQGGRERDPRPGPLLGLVPGDPLGVHPGREVPAGPRQLRGVQGGGVLQEHPLTVQARSLGQGRGQPVDDRGDDVGLADPNLSRI